MKEIGKRLESIIYDNRLSNKDFADRLGISEQSVRNYIAGKRIPTAETLIVLKQTFGISIDWILTGAEEKSLIGANSEEKDSTIIYSKEEQLAMQKGYIESLKMNLKNLESENLQLKKELSSTHSYSKTSKEHH